MVGWTLKKNTTHYLKVSTKTRPKFYSYTLDFVSSFYSFLHFQAILSRVQKRPKSCKKSYINYVTFISLLKEQRKCFEWQVKILFKTLTSLSRGKSLCFKMRFKNHRVPRTVAMFLPTVYSAFLLCTVFKDSISLAGELTMLLNNWQATSQWESLLFFANISIN